ncbi:uncharacterized protein FIBRA_09206 [Fibroporia radiculosa]|uniref:Uncharacterized protein n=1 Tax=Fibroporia radiculosa TaxID=599839 RepID=J7SC54_9APHY|nr:uncharacterized protein FIBRA_09206 [Fibroporia radiculosa]CCM06896.1 predicted protein [Fibroporia radiculosa]
MAEIVEKLGPVTVTLSTPASIPEQKNLMHEVSAWIQTEHWLKPTHDQIWRAWLQEILILDLGYSIHEMGSDAWQGDEEEYERQVKLAAQSV